MGYHTYTVNGYGICTEELKTNLEKIQNFIAGTEFEKIINEYFKENEVIEPEDFDYLDYEGTSIYSGIPFLLREIIAEKEDIHLEIADDYNCNRYLLFLPFYPWNNVTHREKHITIREMNEIFREYVSQLCTNVTSIDFFSVENGG